MSVKDYSIKMSQEKFPTNILYAPKMKFKKPTIYPTPFILNDSQNENNDTFEDSEDSESFNEKSLNGNLPN